MLSATPREAGLLLPAVGQRLPCALQPSGGKTESPQEQRAPESPGNADEASGLRLQGKERGSALPPSLPCSLLLSPSFSPSLSPPLFPSLSLLFSPLFSLPLSSPSFPSLPPSFLFPSPPPPSLPRSSSASLPLFSHPFHSPPLFIILTWPDPAPPALESTCPSSSAPTPTAKFLFCLVFRLSCLIKLHHSGVSVRTTHRSVAVACCSRVRGLALRGWGSRAAPGDCYKFRFQGPTLHRGSGTCWSEVWGGR